MFTWSRANIDTKSATEYMRHVFFILTRGIRATRYRRRNQAMVGRYVGICSIRLYNCRLRGEECQVIYFEICIEEVGYYIHNKRVHSNE